jgi:transposase-like protein
MSTSKRYSPEVRERAVHLVFEHEHEYDSQWAAMASISHDRLRATVFGEVGVTSLICGAA